MAGKTDVTEAHRREWAVTLLGGGSHKGPIRLRDECRAHKESIIPHRVMVATPPGKRKIKSGTKHCRKITSGVQGMDKEDPIQTSKTWTHF